MRVGLIELKETAKGAGGDQDMTVEHRTASPSARRNTSSRGAAVPTASGADVAGVGSQLPTKSRTV